MKAYIVEGGIGKHCIFTAFLNELGAHEKIVILSGYPEMFENHPKVFVSAQIGQPLLYDCLRGHITEYIAFEPYWGTFPLGVTHIMDSWAKGLGLPLDTDRHPEVHPGYMLSDHAHAIAKDMHKFMIVQLSGGKAQNDTTEEYWPSSMARNYPHKEELLIGLATKFPEYKIVDFCLQHETRKQNIHPNVIYLDGHFLLFAELIKYAACHVSIDSCLNHFSAIHQTPGVCLWGATGPHQFGYKHNVNMTGTCPRGTPFCLRPYMRPIGDTMADGREWVCDNPACIDIDPEKIIEAVGGIIYG
jgi:hypothetical protein